MTNLDLIKTLVTAKIFFKARFFLISNTGKPLKEKLWIKYKFAKRTTVTEIMQMSIYLVLLILFVYIFISLIGKYVGFLKFVCLNNIK